MIIYFVDSLQIFHTKPLMNPLDRPFTKGGTETNLTIDCTRSLLCLESSFAHRQTVRSSRPYIDLMGMTTISALPMPERNVVTAFDAKKQIFIYYYI